MLKQKTVLEVKRGDRFYHLQCDPDSPLGELFDVLSEMRSYVTERIVEAQKGQPVEEEKEPEVEIIK